MRKIASVIMLYSLLSACGNGGSKEVTSPRSDEKPIPVRTVAVSQEDVQLSIHASGQVSSDTDAKPSFKTGGVIARILVEEGSVVKKGQLLATLDLTEINAHVKQATEAVDKARRDLQRVKNLQADSVATLENVQDATTGLSVAEENLRMANFNLGYSEIRSPIAGKIIKKLVNQGEIIGPGMPAFYILGAGSADWVIKAGLADRDWARLRTGNRATVHFDAYPGKVFEAKVNQLADVSNPASGTFDVELKLTAPPPRLAAGLIASVEIFPENAGNQVVIPLDALVETNRNEAIIFTIHEGVAQAVPVKIAFLYQDKVVVQSGLENVERVVTDGAPYLTDGMRVVEVK
jgi:RND family efflux transporter MFP subunit